MAVKIFKSDLAKNIGLRLLEIKAIKLEVENPFTWASGWRSPIYCDNRLTLSYPDLRSTITSGFADIVKEQFADADVIAGVATAGIPQGALLADALGLPFIYVRSAPKGHGMGNMIEGLVSPGKKVVVVEDLVSTGGSSLKAVEALKENDFDVLGMVAIFTYEFEASVKAFKDAGVDLVTLSGYSFMIEEAIGQKYVDASYLDSLKAWRESPNTWKQD